MDVTERSLSLAELIDLLGPLAADIVLHDPDGPAECLVRSGELVATPAAVEPAVRRLGSRVDRVVSVERADLARITLRPHVRGHSVDLAAELGPDLAVAANHVHLGCSMLFAGPIMFGTGGRPRPAYVPPAPANELWQPPITVALLDTGLDPHPWFAGRPWLSEWGLSPEVVGPDGLRHQDWQAGHGTFVAGVLLRHAPGVTVRHHRSLSSFGLTDDVTVAAALRQVRRTAQERGERLDLVVLTAGCHTPDDRCPPIVRREITAYSDTIVVAAAGNDSSPRPFWPAALPEVIGVAATAPDDTIAPFSNFGEWVDAAALGVDVVSSYVRFAPADEGVAPGTATRIYGAATWSGTSFAAPRVAAEIARLRHAGMTPEQARWMVCESFRRAHQPG